MHKIIQDATEIDETLSTKTIDLDNPASRIIGSTIILDQFIEMITGVHQFHPDKESNISNKRKSDLCQLLSKYKNIYSIIKNTRRAKDLDFEITCDGRFMSTFSPNIIENIFAILIDNIWKYSLSGTKAIISLKKILIIF